MPAVTLARTGGLNVFFLGCRNKPAAAQQRFEEGKPTGEIVAYKAWFVQEGQDPFQVKFEDKIELPAFQSMIQFDTLQACEVKYNIYFKANDLKEVR